MAKAGGAAAFSSGASTASATGKGSSKGSGKGSGKGRRKARLANYSKSGALDTAILAAEVGGTAYVASYAASRWRSKVTFFEGKDGQGGIDGRWPIGLALAAGGMWLGNGNKAKTHLNRVASGLLLSWLTEAGTNMGEKAALKAAAAEPAPAAAEAAAQGLSVIGEIDPETGAIGAARQRRLGRIDKRLQHLRQQREKVLNRAGIDTPVGGRQPGLQHVGFRGPRAIAQNPGFVTVPAWAVKPAYAMTRGVDEDGIGDD